MTNNCIDCRYRYDCHNSDKEMTCEEFKSYMEEQELEFFQDNLSKCSQEGILET